MRRILCAVFAAAFLLLSSAPALATDRAIAYPAENPPSQQENNSSRFIRLGFGSWIRDALGPNLSAGGVYNNLTTSPNGGMFVAVGPTQANTLGTLYQLAVDDTTPMPAGSYSLQISADSTKVIVQGIQSGPSSSIGPITAPSSGLSQYYVVEAQVQTVDTVPVNETFLDSQGNASTLPVNTVRRDQIAYQLKAGTAAGSPTVPAVDSGWIGLSTILVPSGTATITSGMIAALPAFSGFVANGSNVTLSGLTITGATAGCAQFNSSGVISSQPCTSGLGTVNGTNPISASTSSGVATVSCPNCVAGVSASAPLSANISSNLLTLSLNTIPIASGGTGQTNLPTGILQYSAGTGITAASGIVTGLTAGTGIAVGTGTTPSISLTHGDYLDQSSGAQTKAGLLTDTAGFASGASSYGATSATVNGLITDSVGYGTYVMRFPSGASSGYTGLGAFSSCSPAGIPESLFGINNYLTQCVFSIDTNGNVGTAGNLVASGNLVSNPDGSNYGQLELIANNGATTPVKWIRSNGANGNLEFINSGYSAILASLTDSGNFTATNFFTGSRREWKKNIVPYRFDPLALVSFQIDYAEFDCRLNTPCGVGHKVGFIANDSAEQVAGKKHDHEDAFSLAAIDGAAVRELAFICAALFGVLIVWNIVLTIMLVRRRA